MSKPRITSGGLNRYARVMVAAAAFIVSVLPWVTPSLLMLSDRAWVYGAVNGTMVLCLVAAAAVFIDVLVLLLSMRRVRGAGVALILFVVAGSFASVSAYVAWSLSRELWVEKLEDLAVANAPIVDAIKRYHLESGTPPDHLRVLVPKYLPEIPAATQTWARPLRYARNVGDAPDPWILYISFTSGGGFDEFIYLPSEKYPKEGWGGWLEPIRNWAYVHE